MDQLLRRLQRYYGWRGVDVRQLCREYDVHKMGVIHESQFYRALPRPALSVDKEDVTLLVHKVRAPAAAAAAATFSCWFRAVALVAWHSGRTSVSGRRTFPVLRSTCS